MKNTKTLKLLAIAMIIMVAALAIFIVACDDNGVTRVDVTPQTHSLEVGQTLQLQVNVVGDATNSVTWSSSNNAYATVVNGLVTAVAPATDGAAVTITATSTADTSVYGYASIFVTLTEDYPIQTIEDLHAWVAKMSARNVFYGTGTMVAMGISETILRRGDVIYTRVEVNHSLSVRSFSIDMGDGTYDLIFTFDNGETWERVVNSVEARASFNYHTLEALVGDIDFTTGEFTEIDSNTAVFESGADSIVIDIANQTITINFEAGMESYFINFYANMVPVMPDLPEYTLAPCFCDIGWYCIGCDDCLCDEDEEMSAEEYAAWQMWYAFIAALEAATTFSVIGYCAETGDYTIRVIRNENFVDHYDGWMHDYLMYHEGQWRILERDGDDWVDTLWYTPVEPTAIRFWNSFLFGTPVWCEVEQQLQQIWNEGLEIQFIFESNYSAHLIIAETSFHDAQTVYFLLENVPQLNVPDNINWEF